MSLATSSCLGLKVGCWRWQSTWGLPAAWRSALLVQNAREHGLVLCRTEQSADVWMNRQMPPQLGSFMFKGRLMDQSDSLSVLRELCPCHSCAVKGSQTKPRRFLSWASSCFGRVSSEHLLLPHLWLWVVESLHMPGLPCTAQYRSSSGGPQLVLAGQTEGHSCFWGA